MVPPRDSLEMFVFFSNRAGCLKSLVISAIGTGILLLIMRGCNSGW
jgi:hypothetical protein